MINVVVTTKFIRTSMFLPGLVNPFYDAQISLGVIVVTVVLLHIGSIPINNYC